MTIHEFVLRSPAVSRAHKFITQLMSCIKLESVKMKDNTLTISEEVRGMKKLDKAKFEKTIKAHCYFYEVSRAQEVQKMLKPYLLKMPKFSPIVPGLEPCCRIAYLNPMKIVNGFSDFDPIVQKELAALGMCNDTSLRQVSLTYDSYNHDEILRAIIPKELNSVTGFSIIRHIVHLNLRPELDEYKNIIGQVLLDKIPNARTVVTKTDNIDSKFRNFKMEIIAGEEDFIATTTEHKSIFQLDFSKVYWNPRLSTEHQKFVLPLKKDDVLFDVFCGIGPFVIPSAKKGVKCFANDLNPDSIRWLEKNIKLNRLDESLISISNLDGVKFITDVVKVSLLELPVGEYKVAIAMNLPALAPQFLIAFKGLYKEEDAEALAMRPAPVAHCYCFLKGVPESNRTTAARNLIEENMGMRLTNEIEDVSFVRNVAPKKDMMVVQIRLTENILVGHKRARKKSPKFSC